MNEQKMEKKTQSFGKQILNLIIICVLYTNKNKDILTCETAFISNCLGKKRMKVIYTVR